MRREERVTVQGPVKEQQPDGMSHGGVSQNPGGAVLTSCPPSIIKHRPAMVPTRRPHRPKSPWHTGISRSLTLARIVGAVHGTNNTWVLRKHNLEGSCNHWGPIKARRRFS